MAAQKFKIGDLVIVKWTDAHSVDPWVTPGTAEWDQHLQAYDCLSIGWLQKGTDDQIVVSATKTRGALCATMVIPRGMVKSIRRLPTPKEA